MLMFTVTFTATFAFGIDFWLAMMRSFIDR